MTLTVGFENPEQSWSVPGRSGGSTTIERNCDLTALLCLNSQNRCL